MPVPAGVILVAKPAGVTSHDVVARVRRALGRGVKVGHAGTLDPFATGLLLVLVGRATRAQRFITSLPKTYRTVARLGWRSDTGDRDGELVHTGRVPAELHLPTGEVHQRPPAYSAVRVGGERLYRKARRGEPVEGPERLVHVHRFEQVWRDGERVGLEIECSAGTYVRQLVAALGDAYCEELERTRVGPFSLTEADAERVVPLEAALTFLPELSLDVDDAERVRHGVALPATAEPAGEPAGASPRSVDARSHAGPMRMTHEGRLLAVYERSEERLRALVVFAG